MTVLFRFKGGPRSGNHGHAGRKGKLMGTTTMRALSPQERLEFANAVANAESFDALVKKYQDLILAAERSGTGPFSQQSRTVKFRSTKK